MKLRTAFVVSCLSLAIVTMCGRISAQRLTSGVVSVDGLSNTEVDEHISIAATQNSQPQSAPISGKKKRGSKKSFKLIAVIGLAVVVVAICVAVF